MGKVMNRMTGRLFVAISLSVALGATLAGLWLGPTRTSATREVNLILAQDPCPDEPRYQVENPGDEVMELRARTNKTIFLGENQFHLRAKQNPVHYDDGAGNWIEYNTSSVYVPAQNQYVVTGAAYNTVVQQEMFNFGRILTVTRGTEEVEFQPLNLEWRNDLDQLSLVSAPAEVPATVSNVPETLLDYTNNSARYLYEDAYGPGIDFEWTVYSTDISKLLTIDSLSSLPTPPQYIIDGGNPVLRFTFLFDASDGLDIFVDGQEWDRSSDETTFDYVTFYNGADLYFGFQPAWFMDSDRSDPEDVGTSALFLERRGSSLYVYVEVPYSWLSDPARTYPVMIDPSIDEDCDVSGDDANSRDTPWYSDTETVHYWGFYTDPLVSGYRFDNITVAASNSFDTAILTVWADASDSDSIDMEVGMEDSSDVSAAFNNSSRRPWAIWAGTDGGGVTTAQNTWTDSASWSANDQVDSADFTSSFQEVYDISGSLSSAGVVVLIKGDDSETTSKPTRSADYSGTTYDPELSATYSAACTPDITLTGGNWAIGTVAVSTTYWANGSEPSWPLGSIDCTWSIQNADSGGSIDVNVESTDFTGGVGWNLAGTAGADTVVLTAFEENDGSGAGQVITNSETLFINSISNNNTVFVEMSFDSATSHSDGALKTATVTFTGVCE